MQLSVKAWAKSYKKTLFFPDQDVFLLNSFYQIHSILSLFKGNDLRLANLASEMQLHLDTLSSEQTSNLIGKEELFS